MSATIGAESNRWDAVARVGPGTCPRAVSICLDVLSRWVDVGGGDRQARGQDGPGVDEPIVLVGVSAGSSEYGITQRKALSLGAGAAAAIAMRKLVASVWPGRGNPPLNPADRRVDWREAAAWAVASGIGAGVARLVSKRAAAGAWEKAIGQPPRGMKPSRSPI